MGGLFDPAARHVDVGGVQYCYRQTGRGPAVVLLHGLAETSRVFWRALFARFEREYTLIAVDLKGYGGTAKPTGPYTPAAQAQGVRGFVDRLGLKRPVLLGHSVGGIVAAQYAILFPDALSKLILYDCPIPGGLRRNLAHAASMPVVGVALMSLLCAPPIGRWLFKHRTLAMTRFVLRSLCLTCDPSDYTDEMVREGMRNCYDVIRQGVWKAMIAEDLYGDLQRIRVPTCIVRGEHDALVTQGWAQRTCAQIPDARLVVIRDAGHTALNEQPAPFLQAVSEFLASA